MLCEGLLVVVSGPSGSGKGTLLKLLSQKLDSIRYSISVTTRKPRVAEVDGVHYFFRTVEQFEEMIRNNELLEWDKYCDNYYGTPKSYIEKSLSEGYDIILEITVEGAMNVKRNFPDSVTIFILPPSYDELRNRIHGRGTENSDVIEKRLEKAKSEINYINKYDYVIVNDDIEIAVNDMISILNAEKHRYCRMKKNLSDFLKEVKLDD